MQKLIIYHNPRCSKSRQTLNLIRAQGHEPQIIHYLDTPPTPAELTDLLSKLGLSAAELIRTGEAEYKEHFTSTDKGDEAELVRLMCLYPKVIERPIVVGEDIAVVGRPPENVLKLF